MHKVNLFHGIAVIIDDEINTAGSGIRVIQEQIEEEGCPVIAAVKIPDKTILDRFRGASFFVVDWNMVGDAVAGASAASPPSAPEELVKRNAAEVIDFLKELKKVRFAPVFLFTQESPEYVESQLKSHQELYDPDGSSHIFVASKAEVQEKGVFAVLTKYLDEAPSAYVLKCWERGYERAKNALFIDFFGKSIRWPVILWKTFKEDGLNPSLELGEVIGRNLLSRMTPFDFDLSSFEGDLRDLETNEESYRMMLLKVLEGERFLPEERLHQDSVGPGDIFKSNDTYFINIRPDCDCIAREKGKQDRVELYLLRGKVLNDAEVAKIYDRRLGLLLEKDNEANIFGMIDGKTLRFKFRKMEIKPWSQLKGKRVGRLLPPFLTRMQQRYSAYLQRPGLTRVPHEAVRVIENEIEVATVQATATQAISVAEVSVVAAPSTVQAEIEAGKEPAALQAEPPAKGPTQGTSPVSAAPSIVVGEPEIDRKSTTPPVEPLTKDPPQTK